MSVRVRVRVRVSVRVWESEWKGESEVRVREGDRQTLVGELVHSESVSLLTDDLLVRALQPLHCPDVGHPDLHRPGAVTDGLAVGLQDGVSDLER